MQWLYDPDEDRLARIGWASTSAQSFGDQLVLGVIEVEQGIDLDGDGELASEVPLLYDPESGAVRNTGVEGFSVSAGTHLLIHRAEERSGSDWNGDGDLDDFVMHSWDPRDGRVVNARIASQDVAAFADGFVLFLRHEVEEQRDLNGDDDLADDIAHVYDARTHRVTNLRLASEHGIGGSGPRVLLLVAELDQGSDLNGDGDLLDVVLFLVDPRPGSS